MEITRGHLNYSVTFSFLSFTGLNMLMKVSK